MLARETSGGRLRVKAARLPAVKALDDFGFSFQRSVRKQVVAHLAQLDSILEASNVIFLGPPGTGKTHLSIALAVQAARRGHRVAFATAHQWVQRLDAAHCAGRLEAELDKLRPVPLLVCDEVGYIPFEPEAAALFYASSPPATNAPEVVSSNKPFSAWTEIFGDAVAVAAMDDRLVHHAEIINLKGDSYRLKNRRKEADQHEWLSRIRPPIPVQVSTVVDTQAASCGSCGENRSAGVWVEGLVPLAGWISGGPPGNALLGAPWASRSS